MELNLIVMDFFSYPSNGTDRNVIVFEVDRVHLQRSITEKKNTLIVDKGPTQELVLLKIMKSFVYDYTIMKQTIINLLMVKTFINLKQKILRM